MSAGENDDGDYDGVEYKVWNIVSFQYLRWVFKNHRWSNNVVFCLKKKKEETVKDQSQPVTEKSVHQFVAARGKTYEWTSRVKGQLAEMSQGFYADKQHTPTPSWLSLLNPQQDGDLKKNIGEEGSFRRWSEVQQL